MNGSKLTLRNAGSRVNSQKANLPRLPRRISDWHCAFCDKKLGVLLDGFVEITCGKRLHYHAARPVKAKCPRCGETNIIT